MLSPHCFIVLLSRLIHSPKDFINATLGSKRQYLCCNCFENNGMFVFQIVMLYVQVKFLFIGFNLFHIIKTSTKLMLFTTYMKYVFVVQKCMVLLRSRSEETTDTVCVLSWDKYEILCTVQALMLNIIKTVCTQNL